MPNLTMMTQVNSTDPLDGGLGARKPRPEEIAKSAAESRAKEAAAQRDFSFEKIVHATEKQMRQEAVGEASERTSGSAPLGSATSKLDAHGYLVQATAADRIWPNDFKREINDPGCDLLGVFNDHFGLAARAESVVSLARMSKTSVRGYLTSMAYDKTEGDKVWFSLPAGHRAFLRKQKVSPLGASSAPER